jgi:dihydrofolate synthase/folylpolyglutamate synthase
VVTSIGLDHQDWLGHDLGQIACEKVAIARAGKPLLLGEGIPPEGLEKAQDIGAVSEQLGREIPWSCKGPRLVTPSLPWCDGVSLKAGLIASNVLLAGLALERLQALPDPKTCHEVLGHLSMPGRCESRREAGIELILDVAHNSDAIKHLAEFLQALPPVSRRVTIFAAMADKPIEAMTDVLNAFTDEWFLVPLSGDSRALPVEALAARVRSTKPITCFASVPEAWNAASARAERVLACGSFLTVGAVQACLHG